jgi:hypothetical protein
VGALRLAPKNIDAAMGIAHIVSTFTRLVSHAFVAVVASKQQSAGYANSSTSFLIAIINTSPSRYPVPSGLYFKKIAFSSMSYFNVQPIFS